MRSSDRLGALHVSVGRHEDVLESAGMIEHGVLQVARGSIELGTGIHRPQASCRGNLIIPTTPSVKLRRNLTYFVVKHAIDEGVNIFVGSEWLCASGELLPDKAKSAFDFLAFLERQDPGTPERYCPSLR
jgi:hypothetical protein